MTSNEFVEKFTIKHKDVEDNLTFVKELDLDTHNHKGCFHCNDPINQHMLRSEAWTMVQYCWVCKHINLVFVTDRMGGYHKDTVKCYTNK
jgi:hypothetical protein